MGVRLKFFWNMHLGFKHIAQFFSLIKPCKVEMSPNIWRLFIEEMAKLCDLIKLKIKYTPSNSTQTQPNLWGVDKIPQHRLLFRVIFFFIDHNCQYNSCQCLLRWNCILWNFLFVLNGLSADLGSSGMLRKQSFNFNASQQMNSCH